MKLLFKLVITVITCLTLALGSLDANGQNAIQLSDEATISVITFGPYQGELWSAFGHSGVRVYDPGSNIDWMYDWGRFDFNQANFYWNFAKGQMLYSIGRTRDFGRYRDYYMNADRYIYEQVLNLNKSEKQEFFNALEENYRPENRNYYYNYVYDNCATRIQRITEQAIVDSIYFPYTYTVQGKSVRDLMDDYLDFQPWGDLIIDIGLGNQIDDEAPGQVYMFLPDYVYKGFSEALIIQGDTAINLVAKTNILYESQKTPEAPGIFTPFNAFLILFFIVGLITNRDFKKKKRTKWVDYILFTIVGIFGWWLVFLWLGTDHLSKNNWNLLWAFPLHIPFVYLLGRKKLEYKLSRIYRFLAVLHLLTLVFWVILPQPLHPALVPLVVTLILRSFYISYDLSRI